MQAVDVANVDAISRGSWITSKNKPKIEALPSDSILQPKPAQTVDWSKFNHEAYLAKGRLTPGEDRYAANKFNQAASDAVAWNRDIPDAREYKYGYLFFYFNLNPFAVKGTTFTT